METQGSSKKSVLVALSLLMSRPHKITALGQSIPHLPVWKWREAFPIIIPFHHYLWLNQNHLLQASPTNQLHGGKTGTVCQKTQDAKQISSGTVCSLFKDKSGSTSTESQITALKRAKKKDVGTSPLCRNSTVPQDKGTDLKREELEYSLGGSLGGSGAPPWGRVCSKERTAMTGECQPLYLYILHELLRNWGGGIPTTLNVKMTQSWLFTLFCL